jgi:L-erythrulose 1-phosphate isomerase
MERTVGGDVSSDGLVWLGTSWKMTKTIGEAQAWVDVVLEGLGTGVPGVRAFALPAHTALAAVRDRLALADAPPLLLGAQDAHWGPEGAGTGDVSMRMVADAGARLVEIGHSERRAAHGEDDGTVARKVRAALDAGLRPLVCVGEPDEVRGRGDELAFVSAQVEAALGPVAPDELGRVLLAYEPVWAIGEHGRRPGTEEVAPVLDAVAGLGRSRSSGSGPLVLYGGSVDTGNAADLLGVGSVDGLFVGRAAWDAAGFLALLEVARDAARRPPA